VRTYDSNRHVLTEYPGQMHLGIQGNWKTHFGGDGYLLCAFDDGGNDVSSLPSYVSSVSLGTAARVASTDDAAFMDPRALMAPSAAALASGDRVLARPSPPPSTWPATTPSTYPSTPTAPTSDAAAPHRSPTRRPPDATSPSR